MRRVATLMGAFVALLCLALPGTPAAAASVPYVDLLGSFQNVTSQGITLSSGGTVTDYANPGGFNLPVTSTTGTTLDMAGTQLTFTKGMTTLTLSDFSISGLPSNGLLYATPTLNGGRPMTPQLLSETFVAAPTALTSERYMVAFDVNGASLFNNAFGLNIQPGDHLGLVELPAAVPEPATGVLLGVGLAGALLARRRRLAA